MINGRGRARMVRGGGREGGRTAAVMIRVTRALLSDAWAKTYTEVSKPRVGRMLTEVGGWSVWTAGQPMQLEKNGEDGSEEKGSRLAQPGGRPAMLLSFIPGPCVWGKNCLLHFCVFHCCASPTHLCQAYWALTWLPKQN